MFVKVTLFADIWVYFQEYFRSKIDPVYTRFGWDSGDDDAMKQYVNIKRL